MNAHIDPADLSRARYATYATSPTDLYEETGFDLFDEHDQQIVWVPAGESWDDWILEESLLDVGLRSVGRPFTSYGYDVIGVEPA